MVAFDFFGAFFGAADSGRCLCFVCGGGWGVGLLTGALIDPP